LGGALNAVAGGGSFVAFPALLFTGVGPVAANATNTLALWVGVTASGGAYRKHLNISKRVMIPLIATSIVGGLLGALLLIKTPPNTFLRVLPWLLLAATLLFAFGSLAAATGARAKKYSVGVLMRSNAPSKPPTMLVAISGIITRLEMLRLLAVSAAACGVDADPQG